MNFFRKLSLAGFLLAPLAAPASAGVIVSSPGNGAQLGSPFTLSAVAPNCSSQPIAAMGYSFDDSTSTTIVNGSFINASVTSSIGAHLLHVKAWGDQGAACVTDVAVTVQRNAVFGALSIPLNVIAVGNIQALGNWIGTNDSAGSGSTTGSTHIIGWPSLIGKTRQFVTRFWNSGSERYYSSFASDSTSTNFLYDAYIYLNSSSSHIANLEFDLNQVMPNGQTVIYGFQCDGWSSTWDYTENGGSPANPIDLWVHSSQYCNPRTWSIKTWHHLQISYSRNSSGQVTYNTVYLDDLAMPIGVTVNSAFALGWAPTLLTNFQVDGFGASGSATAFLDNLTIYRW